MSLWTKEKLKELSLFEVRSIAREIGVQSPTSFNKDEVIEKIVDISSGKADPYVKLTNKGRPAKPIGSAVEILEMFLPSMSKRSDNSEDLARQLILSSSEAERGNSVTYQSTGYLDVLKDGYGFIRKDFIPQIENDTFVPENMIKQYKLKKGDELAIVEKDIAGSLIRVAVELKTINNKELDIDRPEFNELDVSYPSKAFEFIGSKFNVFNNYLKIGKGQRVAIVGESSKMVEDHLIKMFDAINAKNKEFIYFNAQMENKAYLKNKHILTFEQNIDKKAQLRTVEMVIENAKRKAEYGEDAVVFINDAVSVLNLLSDTEYISQVVELTSVQKLNNLILNGRKLADHGSVTIIIGVNSREEKGKILAPLLRSSINLNIALNEELDFMGKFPCVDFKQLDFDNKDNLLSDSKLEQFRSIVYKNLNNPSMIIEELNK